MNTFKHLKPSFLCRLSDAELIAYLEAMQIAHKRTARQKLESGEYRMAQDGRILSPRGDRYWVTMIPAEPARAHREMRFRYACTCPCYRISVVPLVSQFETRGLHHHLLVPTLPMYGIACPHPHMLFDLECAAAVEEKDGEEEEPRVARYGSDEWRREVAALWGH